MLNPVVTEVALQREEWGRGAIPSWSCGLALTLVSETSAFCCHLRGNWGGLDEVVGEGGRAHPPGRSRDKGRCG